MDSSDCLTQLGRVLHVGLNILILVIKVLHIEIVLPAPIGFLQEPPAVYLFSFPRAEHLHHPRKISRIPGKGDAHEKQQYGNQHMASLNCPAGVHQQIRQIFKGITHSQTQKDYRQQKQGIQQEENRCCADGRPAEFYDSFKQLEHLLFCFYL